jgi:4-diphosphocytidyl-2C-methyl-D-erythritol kinase
VLFNRLERPAALVEPRLGALRDGVAAVAAPRPVLLTGSGSAVFALARSPEDARALESRLSLPGSLRDRGCRVAACRGVARSAR